MMLKRTRILAVVATLSMAFVFAWVAFPSFSLAQPNNVQDLNEPPHVISGDLETVRLSPYIRPPGHMGVCIDEFEEVYIRAPAQPSNAVRRWDEENAGERHGVNSVQERLGQRPEPPDWTMPWSPPFDGEGCPGPHVKRARDTCVCRVPPPPDQMPGPWYQLQ